LKMNESRLYEIAGIDGVEWVEALPLYMTFDWEVDRRDQASVYFADPVRKKKSTGFESGTRLLGFEDAWKKGWNGNGQMVAMADTGLDSGKLQDIHVDFMGAVHEGYAQGLGSSSWEDPNGHGTHVAG